MKRTIPTLLLLLSCIVTPTVAHASAAYTFLDDEAEPQTDVSFEAQTSKLGGLTLLFDFKDNKNFYSLELMPTSATLRSMIDGTPRRLATAPATWKPSSHVTLKRRAWVMQVIVNRRVVLTAYDATFNQGRIGFAANGGWSWKDERVQPVEEELFFADDFMRLEGQQTEWKEAGGRWSLTASSENINATNVEMSANPFSYQATAPAGAAFAHVGRGFWDNYAARVSVRPSGRGTIGLAVYVQDPKNYLAFLWNATEGSAARQLVRVADGKRTVLASAPGAFLPRQWYRLQVQTSPGYVEAFIDGDLVFKARNDWFGQGGVGLIAQDVSTANFDDVRVQSYDYYRQDFTESATSAWAPLGGVWKAENGVLTSATAPGENGATRVFMTGRDNWNGYVMTASARSGAAGGCGLVVGYRDNKNYTVFRWAGPQSTLPFKGRQQLLRYLDGKATIVRDDPATVLSAADNDGYARVTMRMDAGALAVTMNDTIIAQMADETLAVGRPGLWSQGATPVMFRDAVMFFPPPREKPKVPLKMASDSLMVGWASPSGEWPPSQGDKGLEFWNTGDFFGDTTIEFPWRKAIHARGKLELALHAQRERFESGYIVRAEGTEDKSGVRLSLLQGDKVLKQVDFNPKDLKDLPDAAETEEKTVTEGEAKPQGVPIRIEIEGHGIAISMGGRPVLAYLSGDKEAAPTGTSLAARATGFALRTKDLRAFSANRDDYTFNEAPTDWYSPSGNWSVISRWACYSDWSFFGGQGLNPVLWSKRTYSGDTVVEMYAHNQMDLPKELGYSKPGDLNLTIGGDGKNPSSGYSFVIAGWDNTRSRILKGSEVVGENSTEAARFVKPINHNLAYHRRWYYIRAEVRHTTKNGQDGVQVSLSVDDEPLCSYFDAKPLESFARGGRVAFWSADSTIMIARAKIDSAGMGTRSLPTGLLDAATGDTAAGNTAVAGSEYLVPRAIPSDGLPSAVVERADGDANAGANPSWVVRNPASGGLFAVQLVKPGPQTGAATPFKVTSDTRLETDLALSPGAKVDVYVTINGVRHLIALTNSEKPDARVKLIGESPLKGAPTGDGGWQKVSFALGEALKKLYPNATSWDVEELAVGALHGDAYRWVGFDGNWLGVSYRLRGARLTTG